MSKVFSAHAVSVDGLVTSGTEDAVAAAREAASDKDVALMGGGLVTEELPEHEVIR
jgi:dihydrofolate reductase